MASLASAGMRNNRRMQPKGRWHVLPGLKHERWRLSACASAERIYAVGGQDKHSRAVAEVEELYLGDDKAEASGRQWTVRTRMEQPRYSLSAVFAGGKLIAIGGFRHRPY